MEEIKEVSSKDTEYFREELMASDQSQFTDLMVEEGLEVWGQDGIMIDVIEKAENIKQEEEIKFRVAEGDSLKPARVPGYRRLTFNRGVEKEFEVSLDVIEEETEIKEIDSESKPISDVQLGAHCGHIIDIDDNYDSEGEIDQAPPPEKLKKDDQLKELRKVRFSDEFPCGSEISRSSLLGGTNYLTKAVTRKEEISDVNKDGSKHLNCVSLIIGTSRGNMLRVLENLQEMTNPDLKYLSESPMKDQVRIDLVFNTDNEAKDFLVKFCKFPLLKKVSYKSFMFCEADLGFPCVDPALSEGELVYLMTSLKVNNMMRLFTGDIYQEEEDEISFGFSNLASLNLFLHNRGCQSIGMLKRNMQTKEIVPGTPADERVGEHKEGYILSVQPPATIDWMTLSRKFNFRISSSGKFLIFKNKLDLYKFWTSDVGKSFDEINVPGDFIHVEKFFLYKVQFQEAKVRDDFNAVMMKEQIKELDIMKKELIEKDSLIKQEKIDKMSLDCELSDLGKLKALGSGEELAKLSRDLENAKKMRRGLEDTLKFETEAREFLEASILQADQEDIARNTADHCQEASVDEKDALSCDLKMEASEPLFPGPRSGVVIKGVGMGCGK